MSCVGKASEGAGATAEVQVVLWGGGGCKAPAVPMPGIPPAEGGDGSGSASAGPIESCGGDGMCLACQKQRGGGSAAEVDDGGRRGEGGDGGTGHDDEREREAVGE